MNGYNSIDTDYGIGTILGHFNSEYINHVITDSLNMRFRPFDGAMPNMVDILERQFVAISDNAKDYLEEVSNVRIETYKEIIEIICSFYNLTFTGDYESLNPEEIHGIAHTLYDIFISRFTSHMINFFVRYLIDNSDSIVAYLKTLENVNKPKETGVYDPKKYIDPKFILIHANVNTIMYNMTGYDIPLQILLNCFLDQSTANRIGSLLADNGDIYKNYYASYILDQRYSAGVLTNIKLLLQSKTQELMQI